MRCGMRKPSGLNVRQFTARLNNINKYLALFPGSTLSERNGMTKFNENFLNSVSNSWIKQAYVQGFDCEFIT